MHRLRPTKKQLSGTYTMLLIQRPLAAPPCSQQHPLRTLPPPGSTCARACMQQKDRKRQTLDWCLFEVVRDRALSFLGKATCISIMLDERNGRLLTKYSATDCNLEVRVRCLAQIRDAGGTACGVAEAVHAAWCVVAFDGRCIRA
jgi:hypothetical protein